MLPPSIKIYQGSLDAELVKIFTELPSLLGVDLSAHSLDALNKLRQFSLRPGKRIRGSLAAAAYDQAAGTQQDPVGLRLGAVIELIQSYILIIDDVMDDSALRRGEPTIHEIYAAESQNSHEARMMAVNLGLTTQHLASMLLARIPVAAENSRFAFKLLHGNIAATGFGQMDDLYQRPGRPVTFADIIHKYELKSSFYTFINPMQCGLALAGRATDQALAECKQFGLAAGVAFQLRDDYLGIFGDNNLVGKTNLDDIREGKYTLLMQYALENGTDEDAKTLHEILARPDNKDEDLGTVRNILNRAGAVAYTNGQADNYAKSAKVQLSHAKSWTPEFSALLSSLVDYSLMREK